MLVYIENESSEDFPAEYEQLIIKTAGYALEYEGFPPNAEINVLIVNDEEIQRINKEHRRIDRSTDVLSFPIFDFEKGEHPPKEGEYLLGDIVISIDTAKRQAVEYGHSLQRELGFLTAHSMLHLMGYDHENESEEKEMFRKQEEILSGLGLIR